MVFLFLLAFWGDRKLEVFLQKVLPQSNLSREQFDNNAQKLMTHFIRSTSHDKDGKKFLINILYESQIASLADPVYKAIVKADGKLDMERLSLTAIECKSLAYLLSNSSHSPTVIRYVGYYSH